MPTDSSTSRVLKFGGAALSDGAAIRRACEIVGDHGGAHPIVVVSALEGVTEGLEELARGGGDIRPLRIRHRSLLHQLELSSELLDSFFRELGGVLVGLREGVELGPITRDHLLSFGERMSARIVAGALRAKGFSACPVDAHDLGMVTTKSSGEARLYSSAVAKIRAAIREVPGIPVVTGFLAADEQGNLTTLGRNGSDLTALFIGEAVAADEVQLWKCVAGIQTADPRLVPDAETIAEIGYDDALEIARHGARVIHRGAVLAARRAKLAVSLRDVRNPDSPGTRLVAEPSADCPLVLVHRDGVLFANVKTESSSELEAELAELDEFSLIRADGNRAQLIASDTTQIRELLEAHGAEMSRKLASITPVGSGAKSDQDLHNHLRSAGIELRALGETILVPSATLKESLIALREGVLPNPVQL